MKKMLLLITASVCLSCSLPAQDEAKSIDSLLLKSVNDAEFSGTVLVAKAGKIVLHKGYGYSHEEQKTPNDEQTIYYIASVTKTFTAALILKLQVPVGKDVFKSGEARIEFKRNNTGHIQRIWLFSKGELAQVTKMD